MGLSLWVVFWTPVLWCMVVPFLGSLITLEELCSVTILGLACLYSYVQEAMHLHLRFP